MYDGTTRGNNKRTILFITPEKHTFRAYSETINGPVYEMPTR